MSRPFIVIGDKTDHGGVVVGSTMTTDTHGKRLARVGDQVTCPKKGHGTTVIVTGDPTMIVDGAPVARHGDKCACGATLISSQVVSTVGGGGGGSAAAHSAYSSSGSSSSPDRHQDTSADHEDLQTEFDQRFLVLSTHGAPMSNTPYVITLDSGRKVEGRTDAEGMTEPVSSTTAEMATIEVLRDEPPINPNWDR